MKTFNKQLLTTGALLLALCGLTSFNPLSHYYSDSGSVSLASGLATFGTNGARIGEQAAQTADDVNKQAEANCAAKPGVMSNSSKKSACIQAESAKIANAHINDPAPAPAAKAVIAEGVKCGKEKYTPGDSETRKRPGCSDDQLLQFPINAEKGDKEIGTIVIDSIENVSSSTGSNVIGGGSKSSATARVHYHFVTDKRKLTEGGICTSASCIEALTEDKPLVLQNTDYEDIKKGISDPNSKALVSMRDEIEKLMNHKRDHLAERVAEREKQGCHEKDFIHDVVCFKDKFKKVEKDSEAYADLVSNLKDFVEKATKSTSVSEYNLRMGPVEIAHAAGDSALETEIKAMVDEGVQYKRVAVKHEADAKRLESYRGGILAIDRQLDALIHAGYCSETVTPNVPGVANNNMFGNMNMYQQMNNDPCSGLRSARTQAVMTMENQVAQVQSEYHSSYFIGKTDPFSLTLKSQLGSDYSNLIDSYRPYITDSSLLDLDSSGSSILAATRTQQGQWTRIATPSVINRVPLNGQQQIYNPNMPTSLLSNNQQQQFQVPWANNAAPSSIFRTN